MALSSPHQPQLGQTFPLPVQSWGGVWMTSSAQGCVQGEGRLAALLIRANLTQWWCKSGDWTWQ